MKIENFEGLTFGTELEYNEITREKAALAIQSVVGGHAVHVGGSYDAWEVTATDGKIWKAVSDASIGYHNNSAEVVTPILTITDMPILQEVVRVLRAAGAKAAESCGQHVHIGVKDFSATQVANMVRLFYKQEELILKAVGTLHNRLQYTKPTDRDFIKRLENFKPEDFNGLNTAWFGTFTPNPSHYDQHRYRAMNLNNIWSAKKTVEFRFFNSTTHAGEVKTNILLCLAMALKAKTAKSASARNPRPYAEASAKYDTRVFLLRIGMIGQDFKTARMHLLKRMPGSSAWKNGREGVA